MAGSSTSVVGAGPLNVDIRCTTYAHAPALAACVAVEWSACDAALTRLPLCLARPGGPPPAPWRFAQPQTPALQAQQVPTTHPAVSQRALYGLT